MVPMLLEAPVAEAVLLPVLPRMELVDQARTVVLPPPVVVMEEMVVMDSSRPVIMERHQVVLVVELNAAAALLRMVVAAQTAGSSLPILPVLYRSSFQQQAIAQSARVAP